MKELDYDHSAFSTELIDLGHYGYKRAVDITEGKK